jgi:predicted component of type VI protein secretion system
LRRIATQKFSALERGVHAASAPALQATPNRAEARAPQRPSGPLDTRVVYCGDNLEQFTKLPDACVDLIYIDPPFNSNRNYEVFWGSPREITPRATAPHRLRRISPRTRKAPASASPLCRKSSSRMAGKSNASPTSRKVPPSASPI